MLSTLILIAAIFTPSGARAEPTVKLVPVARAQLDEPAKTNDEAFARYLSGKLTRVKKEERYEVTGFSFVPPEGWYVHAPLAGEKTYLTASEAKTDEPYANGAVEVTLFIGLTEGPKAPDGKKLTAGGRVWTYAEKCYPGRHCTTYAYSPAKEKGRFFKAWLQYPAEEKNRAEPLAQKIFSSIRVPADYPSRDG